MHIVFVSREFLTSPRKGGIGSYVNEVAFSLSKLGHQITVICASNNTNIFKDEIINNVRVIQLDGGDFYIHEEEKSHWGKLAVLKKFRMLYRFSSYRKKIQKTIQEIDNIDVIEVPEYGAEGYYLMNILIPVVVRLHTPSFHDRRTLQKSKFKLSKFYTYIIQRKEEQVLKKANHITSCSEDLKKWINFVLSDVKLPEIKVIYNPINEEKWQKYKSSSILKKENDFFCIFYAGTVMKEKGIGDLLEACDYLTNNKNIKLEINIAGKFVFQKLAFVEKYKKYNWCNFLGNISQQELASFYINSDICCFPSWWENMPMTCIEAMNLGALVIGGNKGGFSEIITDGSNGFLVNPQSPENIVSLIEKIINLDEENKNRIRKNAQITIHEKFSMEIILPEMIAYYSSLK